MQAGVHLEWGRRIPELRRRPLPRARGGHGAPPSFALIGVPVLVRNALIRVFRRAFVRQWFASEHRCRWISLDPGGRVWTRRCARRGRRRTTSGAPFGGAPLVDRSGGI